MSCTKEGTYVVEPHKPQAGAPIAGSCICGRRRAIDRSHLSPILTRPAYIRYLRYMYRLTMCSSSCGVRRCSGHVSNGARLWMSEACRNKQHRRRDAWKANKSICQSPQSDMSGPTGPVPLSWVRRDHRCAKSRDDMCQMYWSIVLISLITSGAWVCQIQTDTNNSSILLVLSSVSVCFIPKDRHLTGELQTLYWSSIACL